MGVKLFREMDSSRDGNIADIKLQYRNCVGHKCKGSFSVLPDDPQKWCSNTCEQMHDQMGWKSNPSPLIKKKIHEAKKKNHGKFVKEALASSTMNYIPKIPDTKKEVVMGANSLYSKEYKEKIKAWITGYLIGRPNAKSKEIRDAMIAKGFKHFDMKSPIERKQVDNFRMRIKEKSDALDEKESPVKKKKVVKKKSIKKKKQRKRKVGQFQGGIVEPVHDSEDQWSLTCETPPLILNIIEDNSISDSKKISMLKILITKE